MVKQPNMGGGLGEISNPEAELDRLHNNKAAKKAGEGAVESYNQEVADNEIGDMGGETDREHRQPNIDIKGGIFSPDENTGAAWYADGENAGAAWYADGEGAGAAWEVPADDATDGGDESAKKAAEKKAEDDKKTDEAVSEADAAANELEKKIADLEKKNSELAGENEKLRAELEDAYKQLDAMEGKIDEIHSATPEGKAKVEKRKGVFSRLKTRVAAGVLAAVLLVGGIVGGTMLMRNQNNDKSTGQAATIEMMDETASSDQLKITPETLDDTGEESGAIVGVVPPLAEDFNDDAAEKLSDGYDVDFTVNGGSEVFVIDVNEHEGGHDDSTDAYYQAGKLSKHSFGARTYEVGASATEIGHDIVEHGFENVRSSSEALGQWAVALGVNSEAANQQGGMAGVNSFADILRYGDTDSYDAVANDFSQWAAENVDEVRTGVIEAGTPYTSWYIAENGTNDKGDADLNVYSQLAVQHNYDVNYVQLYKVTDDGTRIDLLNEGNTKTRIMQMTAIPQESWGNYDVVMLGDCGGSQLGLIRHAEPTPEVTTPAPQVVTPTPETVVVTPTPDTTPETTPTPDNTPTPDTTPENTPTPDTTPDNTPTPDTTPDNTPTPDTTPDDTPTPTPTPTPETPDPKTEKTQVNPDEHEILDDTPEHDNVNYGDPDKTDENDRQPGDSVNDADTSAIPDNQQVLDENGNPRTDENGNPYVQNNEIDPKTPEELEQSIQDGTQTTQSDSTEGRDPNSQQEVDTDHPTVIPEQGDPNSRTGEDVTFDDEGARNDFYESIFGGGNQDSGTPTAAEQSAGQNDDASAGAAESQPAVAIEQNNNLTSTNPEATTPVEEAAPAEQQAAPAEQQSFMPEGLTQMGDTSSEQAAAPAEQASVVEEQAAPVESQGEELRGAPTFVAPNPEAQAEASVETPAETPAEAPAETPAAEQQIVTETPAAPTAPENNSDVTFDDESARNDFFGEVFGGGE